jgi:hypothetical protein
MTTTSQDLLDLAEIVERASVPDRRLDFDIWSVVTEPTGFPALGEPEATRTQWFYTWKDHDGFPRYTESVDAAMTLVPEGIKWKVGWGYSDKGPTLVGWAGVGSPRIYEAASPAAALTAACLRAMAKQRGEK